ncbi:MAG TPA: FtsW/RodA/SpoVE family cell cycle protein, partial [Candidatus Kapabacteria bacterium]|nr:FtsW/RodA/SpoVE family cell cycle protein [Candidatus Kapabacteria bacterium]
MKKNVGYVDWLILIPVVGLMLFSLAFVYSASATIAEMKFGMPEKLVLNHSIRVIGGIILMLIISRVDYHLWQKISKPLLIASIILLVVVLFAGEATKGASRWLRLGFFSFQPSELAKFAMVLHFAALLTRKQDVIKDFKQGFLPFIVWTLIICGLIALQPNFSTMIVIFFIAIALMFIGNVNLIHLFATGLIGIAAAGVYAVSATYRMNRIKAFLGLDGNANPVETVNYQLNQALIAIGNGGLFGVGPGQNRQS